LNALFIALGDYQDADVMDGVVSELYKVKYTSEWTNRKVFLKSLRIVVKLARKR